MKNTHTHRGHCQLCGRVQAIDSASGITAKHGYTVEFGYFSGTCPGSDKPNLKAEFSAEPHVRGVCSMARTNQPDTANSQFFIVFDDARFLDKQYTVWGQVTDGMDLIDALPKGEPPREPGKIVKARAA